jgi:Flp pilus assembly protein TadD
LYDAHTGLALAYRAAEQVGPWRAAAQRAIELNPREAEASTLLGDWYSASPTWGCARDRDPVLAQRSYGQAISLDPRFAVSYHNLGSHLLGIGRPADALRALEEGLTIVGDNRLLRQMRARALVALGRVVEAEREALELSAGRPPNQDIERTFGGVALARGNVDAARRHFDQAIGVGDSAFLRVNIAASFAGAGRIADAVAHLEHAFAMDHGCVQFVADSPLFTIARNHPSLKELLSKSGK